MPRYTDVKTVLNRFSEKELAELKKSVVHPNPKEVVTGEENTGVVLFRRKAQYRHPLENSRGN